MLDEDTAPAQPRVTVTSRPRRRAAGRPAGPPRPVSGDIFAVPGSAVPQAAEPAPEPEEDEAVEPDESVEDQTVEDVEPHEEPEPTASPGIGGLLFQAPPATLAPALPKKSEPVVDEVPESVDEPDDESVDETSDDADEDGGANKRRRRSRGGRRRRKSGGAQADGEENASEESEESESENADAEGDETGQNGSSRRRRSRRRAGDNANNSPDDPENTVVKVREGRSAEDEITGVTGSTRLEAKKQRRREGREAGRRRAPIVSEAEFLARRESVDRQMIVRQHDDYTQIAVLEDKVLVEHYVARESQTSIIGNVYLGKVQNVLPSMEAAFVDIGAGRNAVLYAGEVDWSSFAGGKQRKIEEALTPGQTVLVQASKDPIGQKGARLTSQISLPGRYLVYVPGGQNHGISRKLPDTERSRLKKLLSGALPEEAGVIVRTAAEGATEEQLTRDITSLKARWEDIERKAAEGKAPELLYAEPDLLIKVVRDLFNEDFSALVVEGRDAGDSIASYVAHVAPDLADRVVRWEPGEDTASHVFAEYRVDEQIHKALDRKVWLPSGGSLVIDRTEAMTVVDVNTGKFTGSGGNLEETVTKNNLEAAEEVVRQLRLRDIGGIIVVDFIDMVLESNRDLVLRRLVECLGRDRTRHQVAEVTSLGLVQMTRKRIGTGLLESFGSECEHCKGRGVQIHAEPVEPRRDEGRRRGGRGGRNKAKGQQGARGDQSQQQNGQSRVEKPQTESKPAEQPQDDQPESAEVVEATAVESVAEQPVAEPVVEQPAPEQASTPTLGSVPPPPPPPFDIPEPASTDPVLTDEGQAP
ncbi:MAG: Rne/Rng family ribonuclease [Aeromicrobium sp.]|uniref:Rne/Rng family ribonuclease n=1 Tax=Aeromicrobium sp. TaxID=1871063 RepID=UPI0039E67EFD